MHDGVATWIILPPDQRPPEWQEQYYTPVVRLTLNIHGHQTAALAWEKHCESAIPKCGFHRIKGWECLYAHREEKLFLSVYVDDFKLAGNATALRRMWKTLAKFIDIDEPSQLSGNVYLGCAQHITVP